MLGWILGNDEFNGLHGGPAGMNSTFDKEYHAFPAAILGRDDIECGNKIILASSALDLLSRLHIS